MSGYAELRGRRMLVVMTSRGTLLRPNIKDADVSVADDLIEALTYTMPRSEEHTSELQSH